MKKRFGIIALFLMCFALLFHPTSVAALSNEYSQFDYNSLSTYSEEELFALLAAISNELVGRRKVADNSNPTEPVLSEGEKDYSEEEISSIVNEILQYKNSNTVKAWKLIEEYSEYMTDEQLESVLLSYGKFESVNKAEEKLKTYLKSPRSFQLYGGSIYSPDLQEDGSYKVKIEIEYGATNSFGAEIKDNVTMYSTFTIDLKNVSVSFKDVDLSPYDKLAMFN